MGSGRWLRVSLRLRLGIRVHDRGGALRQCWLLLLLLLLGR